MAEITLLRASNPADRAAWSSLVAATEHADIYFLPGYVSLYSDSEENAAALLVRRAGEPRCLLPIVLRRAPVPESGGRYQDAITPYGYGGVCPLAADFPARGELGEELASLKAWAEEQGIICFLIRLHPLLGQASWVEELQRDARIRVSRFSPTTALDLANWDGRLAAPVSMRKGRRSDLSFARRKLRTSISQPRDGANHQRDLELFQQIYLQSMERLNASAFVRFDLEYFRRLSQAAGDAFALVMTWQEELPAGGAVFLAGKTFAHYHLSATTDCGRVTKAATLQIVAGAEWARSAGRSKLFLGGGNTGSDPLFEFKRSFGGEVLDYLAVIFVTDEKLLEETRTNPAAGWPFR